MNIHIHQFELHPGGKDSHSLPEILFILLYQQQHTNSFPLGGARQPQTWIPSFLQSTCADDDDFPLPTIQHRLRCSIFLSHDRRRHQHETQAGSPTRLTKQALRLHVKSDRPVPVGSARVDLSPDRIQGPLASPRSEPETTSLRFRRQKGSRTFRPLLLPPHFILVVAMTNGSRSSVGLRRSHQCRKPGIELSVMRTRRMRDAIGDAREGLVDSGYPVSFAPLDDLMASCPPV